MPGCLREKSKSALPLGPRACLFSQGSGALLQPRPSTGVQNTDIWGTLAPQLPRPMSHWLLTSRQPPSTTPAHPLDTIGTACPQLQPPNPWPKTPLPWKPHLTGYQVLQILNRFSNLLPLLWFHYFCPILPSTILVTPWIGVTHDLPASNLPRPLQSQHSAQLRCVPHPSPNTQGTVTWPLSICPGSSPVSPAYPLGRMQIPQTYPTALTTSLCPCCALCRG